MANIIEHGDGCMPGVDSWAITIIAGSGIIDAGGRGAPRDGVRGFLPGCTYRNVSGGPGSTFYTQKGTLESADWLAVS